MLTHLYIRDFAIIESIEIDFKSGLMVLTGETGAGKSILVDALQLAVGGRAGAEVVRHEAERAEISATFDLATTDLELRTLLAEQSIEADQELIVRRVITREGKSRAYLNGQQVPVQTLRAAGEWLAEIHGQHEFQSLLRPASQRTLLDTYGACESLAHEVLNLHRERLAQAAALSNLEDAARNRDKRLELLTHETAELTALNLQHGELDTLTAERNRLANSGRLAESARAALDLVYEQDGGNAHSHASRALTLLRQGATVDCTLDSLLSPLEDAVIRLADTGAELTRYLDNLEADPVRQAQAEQRLANIESLARKHRVNAVELPGKTQQLQNELSTLNDLDENLVSLRSGVTQATGHWRKAAEKLSLARIKAASALGAAITARMQTLGMAGGCFVVELPAVATTESIATGLEEINLQVSANAGQPPRPLGKVASGGELSRLSLAVQVTLATHRAGVQNGPAQGGCMVFDEVDSGVGGAVAEIVGRELAALGASAQVLCVTHLPQVASLGDHHLQVLKISDGRSTSTKINALEGTARIEEIARMLGGIAITDKAREHAAEMLQAGRLNRREKSSDVGKHSVDSARKSRVRAR